MCLFSVFGFRGDLEIFGYNLLHWLNGSLPWEKDIKNAAVVEQKKTELMADVEKFIKKYMPKVPDGNNIITIFQFIFLLCYI